MYRWLLRSAGILFLIYIAFDTFLTLSQKRVVYQPDAQDFFTCTALAGAEHVIHNSTRMYVQKGARGIVVLYHGNAGSACDRAFYVERFTAADYGYAPVEYAGFSNDPQQTTHTLVQQDVRNTIAYLEEQRIKRILVVGESIGTGAAAYHISIAPPEKLLLNAPFTTLPEVAKEHYWYYPHTLGQSLYETLPTEHSTLVTIPNRGHNDLFNAPETLAALDAFLNE